MNERQTKNLTDSFTFTTLAIYAEALTAAQFNNTVWRRQLQFDWLLNFLIVNYCCAQGWVWIGAKNLVEFLNKEMNLLSVIFADNQRMFLQTKKWPEFL
jgi:hypothetical protein